MRIRKNSIIFHFLVVVISITVTLMFIELLVRWNSRFGFITPEILRRKSLEYEPSIFSRHVFPQKEKHAIGWGGKIWYINDKGYRGKDFSVTKLADTIRIIFYGGSAVFDSGSGKGEDWPHRVEDILKESGFSQVEVINAGTPGHASFDCIGRLFAEGHRFSPDYVVLNSAWNDIKYFRIDKSLLRHFKPLCKEDDPRLNYRNSVDRFLCEHSQTYERLRAYYYARRLRLGPEGVKPVGKYTSQISEQALKQYRLNLEMFVDLARNIGAVPILMTQPRLVQPDNSQRQKARIAHQYQLLTHQALYEAFEKTEGIVRNIAKRKKVSLIDASKTLSGRDELFLDHVHLTDKGSRKLADITAGEIIHSLRKRKAY